MPVAVSKLSHVILSVSDMERSLAFYRDVLGLEVLFELGPEDFGENGPRVRAVGCLPGGETMIELTAMLDAKAPVKTEASTMVALSVADIHEAHEQLRKAGVEPTMPPTELVPGLPMMFLKDPDGRQIELVQFPDGATNSLEYSRAHHG